MSSQFWMNLQNRYELELAEDKLEDGLGKAELPDIRTTLLEIIAEMDAYIRKGPTHGSLQQGSILQKLQKRLVWSQPPEVQQAS